MSQLGRASDQKQKVKVKYTGNYISKISKDLLVVMLQDVLHRRGSNTVAQIPVTQVLGERVLALQEVHQSHTETPQISLHFSFILRICTGT